MALDWDNIEIIAEDENIVRLTDWNNVEIVSEEDEYLVKTSDSDIINVDACDRMIIFSGQPGEDGKPGKQGEAGKMRVGITTTLPAGSSATVTNRGTDTNAILDFGIPRGEGGVWGEIIGDISAQTDLGDLATEDDAPMDNKSYVRKNKEWVEAQISGSSSWGEITGTLSDQTDLQTALDSKVNSESIADEYDPESSYSDGDLVMQDGKLYRIDSSGLVTIPFTKMEVPEIQASGSADDGDYLSYQENLYLFSHTSSVTWDFSSAEQAYQVLSPFLTLISATDYDPNTTYSDGDIITIGADWYEYDENGEGVVIGSILAEVTVEELLDEKANSADLGNLAEKDTVDWDTDITDIPTTFPPSAHTHDDRYYTESEIDGITSTINARIDALNDFSIHVCTSGEYDPSTYEPTIQNPQENVFYFVPSGTSPDLFTEWIYVSNSWEIFGSSRIDLSDYVTNSQMTTALSGKQDTLTFDNAPTSGSSNPVKSGGVYSALTDKANTADLGDLAMLDSIDYTSNKLTNKPSLGALASMSSIDYTSNKLTNKPTLGSLADQDTVDYVTEVTNKPTLGSLASKNSVDYSSNEVTNKPTLGTLASKNDVSSDDKIYVRKNGTWIEIPAQTAPEWGDITGTLADQSDLKTALDGKVDYGHGAYYVVGTQTASTASWTGNLPDVDALYNGLTIDYWLPFAGVSNTNTTLNLTLKDGTNTGAINCYYSGTTRLTTHIGANNVCRLIYQTVTISGTNYTGWWLLKAYDTNDSAIKLSRGGGYLTADSVIYRYQLLFSIDETTVTPLNNVSNDTGMAKAMLTNVEFDPFGEIFYWDSAATVNAGESVSTTAKWASQLSLRYTFNCGTTLTSHKPLYLKVLLQSNGKVKIADSLPITHDLPITNDGILYIFLGRTYSNYQLALYPWHPIYYHDGTGIKAYLRPHTHDDRYYTEAEIDSLLSAKANTADLGDLAGLNSISYTSNYLTNKPTLGDLSSLNSIDYTSNKLTNKPTLGSLADQDTVNYETEVTNKPTLGALAGKDTVDWDTDIDDIPTAFPPSSHDHDDRYYTESETDTLLLGKSNVGHSHDSRYYQKSEVDDLVNQKTDILHHGALSVSAGTNTVIFRYPATGISSKITAFSLVLDCSFANPEYITSDVTWTSYNAGYIEFVGTCTAATTASVTICSFSV